MYFVILTRFNFICAMKHSLSYPIHPKSGHHRWAQAFPCKTFFFLDQNSKLQASHWPNIVFFLSDPFRKLADLTQSPRSPFCAPALLIAPKRQKKRGELTALILISFYILLSFSKKLEWGYDRHFQNYSSPKCTIKAKRRAHGPAPHTIFLHFAFRIPGASARVRSSFSK